MFACTQDQPPNGSLGGSDAAQLTSKKESVSAGTPAPELYPLDGAYAGAAEALCVQTRDVGGYAVNGNMTCPG